MPPPNPPRHELDGAFSRVKKWLAEAKWRKARDELKPLVKLDAARFGPLLIEANVGLIREMLGKGMRAEAEQVLAYLKSIAPAEVWKKLAEEMAAPPPVAPLPTARPAKLPRIAGSFPEAVAAARALAAGRELSQADWCSLDMLVIAEELPPETSPEDEVAQSVTAGLRMVWVAMEAFGRGDFAATREALRPLPMRSPLQHWRAFFRGAMVVHAGEWERAIKLLESIPPGTPLAQASVPWLLVAGAKTKESVNAEDVCAVMLGLAGLPSAWVAPLVQADLAWGKHQGWQAYQALRHIPSFPSDSPSFEGLLTNLLLSPVAQLPQNSSERYLEKLSMEILGKARWRHATEEKLLRRFFALVVGRDMPPESLESDWLRFLELEVAARPNPRLLAVGMTWLGKEFSSDEPSVLPFFFARHRPKMRSSGRAEKALKTAMKLDPKNAEAALALCSVYENLKRTSDRNRLLDEMTVRFPKHKTVLATAGQEASRRKAWTKALDYLGQALELDPLDSSLQGELVHARLTQLRESCAKGKPAKAGQWEALEPLLNDRPEDFLRSRWSCRLRRAVLDPATFEANLAEGRRLAPSFALAVFFELWARAFGKAPERSALRVDWAECLTQASCAEAARLARFAAFGLGPATVTSKVVFECTALLNQYMTVALSGADDPDGALVVAEAITALGADKPKFLPCFFAVQAALREAWKGKRGKDPRIRLAVIMLQCGPDYVDASVAELESLIAAATKAGQPAVAAKAEKILALAKRFDFKPPFGHNDLDDFPLPPLFQPMPKPKGQQGTPRPSMEQPNFFDLL